MTLGTTLFPRSDSAFGERDGVSRRPARPYGT
jgi:hypothetical protein